MRRFNRMVLLAAVWLAALPLAGQSVPAFRDLFNGKDLKGWINVNTDEDTWTVKEGFDGMPTTRQGEFAGFIVPIRLPRRITWP